MREVFGVGVVSMSSAYRASILHSLGPDHIEYFDPGILLVAANGRVLAARAAEAFTPTELRGVHVTDLSGRLIIPGFVDAHLHIPQVDIIGIESASLIDWLHDHVFAEEMANEDPAIARDRARRTFAQLLRNGTTACAAFSSRHTEATTIAFEEAEKAGVRAIIGKVLMDREAPAPLLEEASSALADTERLIHTWHGRAGGRLEVAVTPRFGVSCSDELLAGAGRLAARHDVPVQTHLSENKGELAVIARQFPHAPDYTSVYEHAGLVRPRCLLAHCIHLSDEELRRIAAASAAAVYCPDSNFFLHSGRFPLQRARAAGVTVALGSDVGAGTSFSLFAAMKMGNYMQTEQVDPALLFYLATMGGAASLGWQDRIGNFAPGKCADFVVLDPTEILRGNGRATRTPRELLSILIHRAQESHVERVYIEGRQVR
ncbi:MAG: guanine deaminase [Planctomycetota bacterium]